jgi:DNA-binding NarL/FixJ family response regulator
MVEDSEAMRGELGRLLSMLPAAKIVMETASQSGASAWILQHPHGWDLALVDLFLETGNGFGVLKACRSRSGLQKVVVMTNYVNDLVKSRVEVAGADAFFDKSSELDKLGAYCRSLSQTIQLGP